MSQWSLVIFYLGLVAYTAASTLFFVDLARRDGAAPIARWAPGLLALGGVFHATHVVMVSLLSRLCPVGSAPFALSLSALLAVIVYLALRRKSGLDAVGVVIAPLALTFLVVAEFVSHGPNGGDPAQTGVLLHLHVLANLIGLGLFLLAGTAGGFYLVQEHRLKAKRLLPASRLPALDALDSTEHRLLLAGFPLLTFGIVTGGFFLSGLDTSDATIVLRTALGYATWALVAAVLLLRALAGWRGRRAAYGTLAGVACVLAVMFLYLVRAGGTTS